MENCNRCGGIDGNRREMHPGVIDAQKSLQRFRQIICLYPGSNVECLTAADAALKNGLVGYQYFSAAVGQNPANLCERKKWVQRDCNTTSADDRQEPVETLPCVAAIDGDRLTWQQPDLPTEKGVDR